MLPKHIAKTGEYRWLCREIPGIAKTFLPISVGGVTMVLYSVLWNQLGFVSRRGGAQRRRGANTKIRWEGRRRTGEGGGKQDAREGA